MDCGKIPAQRLTDSPTGAQPPGCAHTPSPLRSCADVAGHEAWEIATGGGDKYPRMGGFSASKMGSCWEVHHQHRGLTIKNSCLVFYHQEFCGVEASKLAV